MKKILSLALAATMAISCCAMNAFAASKAHTVTIVPSKTTGLAVGETVVVEVTMDNTEALVACGYELKYDTTAFTADQTKVNRVEKCIDKPWLDDIKNADGDWAYYLGNPTYNVATAGIINFQWGGSEGVEADYAVDNRVIGKFNLTVADGAADGVYTFTLAGTTLDAGENTEANMVCAPVKVRVGEEPAPSTSPDPTDPPATPDPTEDPATPTPEVNYIAPDNAVVNTGAVWTAETYTDIDTDANNYEIVFAANDGAKATFALDFGNIVTSGSATFDIVLRTAKTIVGYVINAIAK